MGGKDDCKGRVEMHFVFIWLGNNYQGMLKTDVATMFDDSCFVR